MKTCGQLGGEGSETHLVDREQKEKEPVDTGVPKPSTSRRQDDKLGTTSGLPSGNTIPATPAVVPPKPRSHTTNPRVCCEPTSPSSGSIGSFSRCSHGVADQRSRSVPSPRQDTPTVDCREGMSLNGVSRKRGALKDNASSLAQGGSANSMEDTGPMPCTERSLQGARTEKKEDGRSSSGLLKLSDDSFTPHEMEVRGSCAVPAA